MALTFDPNLGDSGGAAIPPTGDPSSSGSGPAITPGADQPIEIRLEAGTSLHGEVLKRIVARLELSRKHMTSRYDDWDRSDDTLRMFMDLSRKARRADKLATTDGRVEMPFEGAIVIPVSYATHEVRKTQMFSLFAYRDPALTVGGRGPEDVKPAKLMEAALSYDMARSRYPSFIYSFTQDADKYGLGIGYDTWEVENGWVQRQPTPIEAIAQQVFGIKPNLRTWAPVREFNKWTTVDPFNFWPDPRISLSDIQNAEFCGHRFFRGYSHLLERSQQNGGVYFNVDDLGKQAVNSTGKVGRARNAVDDFTLTDIADEKDKGFYTLDHFQIKIQPSEWKLGPSTSTEIWWFTVANETTIIRAHRCPYEHGQFTYSVGEINPDPHTIFNPGMVENLDGIQRTINWLYNSRIENVRRMLNNAMVYSPLFLEEGDLLEPGPAGHIRMTALAEEMVRNGVPVGSLWQQFIVQDITQPHMQVADSLFEMAQRMTAAADPAMSQPVQADKTLGEVQMMMSSSSQRLQVTAMMLDTMAITPMAERAIANRQQLTSFPQYFRIAGDLAAELGGNIRQLVQPTDIQGNFDYIPHSSIMPTDPARLVQTWQQILSTVLNAPPLQQPDSQGRVPDVNAIFVELVKTMGVKDIESFFKALPPPAPPMPPPQVMPDEAIQRGVQAGNIVPMPPAPPLQ